MTDRSYLWLKIALLVFIALQSIRIIVTQDEVELVGRFEDDAFFYLKIADNAVDSGRFSFDGLSPTNGFHPLWMGFVVLLKLFFRDSLSFVASVSLLSLLLMGWCGVVFLRNNQKAGYSIPAMLVFLLLLRYIRDFSMMSMETSLVLPLTFLLLSDADKSSSSSGKSRYLLTGFLIAAMVLARLDSIILGVILVVYVAARHGARTLFPLVMPGVTLLVVYAMVNHSQMGVFSSVSSAMKASGFGFNNLFAEQLFLLGDPLGARSPWGLYLLLLLSAFPVLVIRKLPDTARVSSLFLILFTASQLFLSQWRLWYWYTYPAVVFLVFGFTPLLHLAIERLRLSRRLRSILEVTLGAAALLVGIYWGIGYGGVEGCDFRYRNALIARELNRVLPDSSVVTMGDRAGSFAYFFHGHVIQAEGLAGDLPLLLAIKKGELEKHLHSVGADYLLSWTGPHEVENYECWDLIIPDRAQCSVFNNTIRVYEINEIYRWTGEHESAFLWYLYEN